MLLLPACRCSSRRVECDHPIFILDHPSELRNKCIVTGSHVSVPLETMLEILWKCLCNDMFVRPHVYGMFCNFKFSHTLIRCPSIVIASMILMCVLTLAFEDCAKGRRCNFT